MNRIRVLLADDQSLFREGLRTLLSVQPDLEVVGEAANGAEALTLAASQHPQVVLMDVHMPVLDGVTATRKLHESHPAYRVIMLTTFDDDEYVFEGLRAGAVGYLLKDTPSQKLFEAIRAAARGESFLEPSVAAKVVAEFARLSGNSIPSKKAETSDELSDREMEIVRLLARGLSNREIAEQLVITEGTVKNHVSNILSKLGVRDRTQAVLKAKENGWV
ncbi:MAG: response regulator transcription factor [Chloroflexi bacterium]|nr:response regulator transcription factor [Chloroflexota bacterium]